MLQVQTKNAPQAIGPYSQGIVVNNLFYSSGQIPLRPDGTLVEGDSSSASYSSILKI